MNTVGERIRRIRQQRQLSADDLAFCLNGECCISCIEAGERLPTIETAERIAQVLGVPLHRLFYDGSQPPPLPNLPKRLMYDDIVERIARK